MIFVYSLVFVTYVRGGYTYMRCRERRTDAKTMVVPATFGLAKTDLSI
jgi:hypothetical protein